MISSQKKKKNGSSVNYLKRVVVWWLIFNIVLQLKKSPSPSLSFNIDSSIIFLMFSPLCLPLSLSLSLSHKKEVSGAASVWVFHISILFQLLKKEWQKRVVIIWFWYAYWSLGAQEILSGATYPRHTQNDQGNYKSGKNSDFPSKISYWVSPILIL